MTILPNAETQGHLNEMLAKGKRPESAFSLDLTSRQECFLAEVRLEAHQNFPDRSPAWREAWALYNTLDHISLRPPSDPPSAAPTVVEQRIPAPEPPMTPDLELASPQPPMVDRRLDALVVIVGLLRWVVALLALLCLFGLVASLRAQPTTFGYGYVTTGAPSYSNNTWQKLSLDPNGNLRIAGTLSIAPNSSVNITMVGGSNVSTAAPGVMLFGLLGNSGAALDGVPGSAAPANAMQVGGTDGTNTRVHYMDPCEFSQWQYYPINVSSNTQVVAGSVAKNVYVCKLFIAPVAAAANVNIVESATSGNACATSPTGMLGGATAALGAQISANGGFVLPADLRAWAKTATSGDAVCIFASAQVTGVLAYVQF